jgi:hypothetical protein
MTKKSGDSARELGANADVPVFFNPARAAEKVREVEVRIVDGEKDQVTSRWFHGPDEIDFFVWQDHRKNIIKQQVSFYGQIVEWNILDGLRTGVVLEEETTLNKVPASELVRYDQKPMRPAVETALALVKNARSVTETLRSDLTEHFVNPKSINDLDPEVVLRLYGSRDKDGIWTQFQKLCRKIFS